MFTRLICWAQSPLQRCWADAMWTSKHEAFNRFTLSVQPQPQIERRLFFPSVETFMFHLRPCTEVTAKRQELAVKFSSGSEQTLTSTFRVHCPSLMRIDLYDGYVGAHGIASKKEKKYDLICFSVEIIFVWQMWGTVSLDRVQTFIAISADWYLNVTGFNTVGSDVDIQSIVLDLLPVVFLGVTGAQMPTSSG